MRNKVFNWILIIVTFFFGNIILVEVITRFALGATPVLYYNGVAVLLFIWLWITGRL